MKGLPARGEIWYVKLPTDPPDKTERPVVIVSLDARNRHRPGCPAHGFEHEVPTHIRLSPGETILSLSSIRAEDVTVVRKESLIEQDYAR